MENPISDNLISEYTAARERLMEKSDALAKALKDGLLSGSHYELMRAGGALHEWRMATIEFDATMQRIEVALRYPARPVRPVWKTAFADIWPLWLMVVCTVSMALLSVFGR